MPDHGIARVGRLTIANPAASSEAVASPAPPGSSRRAPPGPPSLDSDGRSSSHSAPPHRKVPHRPGQEGAPPPRKAAIPPPRPSQVRPWGDDADSSLLGPQRHHRAGRGRRLGSDLIRIDTTNPGDHSGPGERQAAEHVAALLAEVGLEPTILESAPGRTSVVTRITGEDQTRPALLIHGHLDVVPADAADWQVDPFSGHIGTAAPASTSSAHQQDEAASGAAAPST